MSDNAKNNGVGDAPQEREVFRQLALEFLKEKRRARRWGIFFKLFIVIYLTGILIAVQSGSMTAIHGKQTALIDMDGVIGPTSDVTADNVIQGLRDAFSHSDVKGVILRANSPGGSPVQAAYINDEIRRLRKAHPKVPIYAVISDVCASGCYYAVAGVDKIFANKGSIVGSIGVLMDGFGFVGAMKKLGIERRLFTSGAHKGMLDPFSPLNPGDKAYVQKMLDQIHRQFIAVVKAGRGKKLAHDPELFSGRFWTGAEAKKLGLVDDFGSAGYVAREVIGAPTIVDYTPKRDVFERFAKQFGVAMAKTLGMEARYSLDKIH